MKTILFISFLIFQTVYAKEAEYKLVSSHDELKMLLETEDNYISYRINTYLSENGLYLVKTDSKRIDFSTALRLYHDLEPGSKDIKRLYKLRGKQICFTVYQAKDEMTLSSFKEELCK